LCRWLVCLRLALVALPLGGLGSLFGLGGANHHGKTTREVAGGGFLSGIGGFLGGIAVSLAASC